MKNIKIGYYLREGMKSIFTHGFLSFASVFTIVACLIIMGSFSLLAVNVNSMIEEFENENVILAYVDESLSVAEAQGLGPQIEALSNIRYAEFTTREEAMESFIAQYEDTSRFENIDSSVFRHRFSIYVDDISYMAQTQRDISAIRGIAKVNANLLIARGFVTIRNVVSGVSLILIAVLLVISFFIMSNTIKLATFERREEIAIMKVVGATNGFIRWPFVFEGFILGLFGSFVAYLIQWGLYTFVTDAIISGNVTFLRPIPFSHTAIPLLIVFVFVGFAVGVIGSTSAIKKYLKI